MRNFLKNSLKALSLGTLMFATCKQIMAQYGVPTDYFLKQIINIVTENNEPIKGLEVSLYYENDTSISYTNEYGKVQFAVDFESEHKITVKDVDGEENLGSFPELNAIITKREETIVLKKEKNNPND